MRAALAAVLVLEFFGAVSRTDAQGFAFTPRVQAEVRADAAVAHRAAALAMVGANVPIGYYVRAGLAIGGGAVVGNPAQLATRADAVLRFLLDPFGENRWGPYAGGGFTVRRDGWARPQAGLLVVLGVDGRRGRRWTPSVEAGLGEGARFAFVLRSARTNGR